MTEINLEPPILDLVLYAGDGADIHLLVTDPDDEPLDVTGDVKAQIRATREAADPAAADFSVDLSDASNGVVILSLTGEETHAMIDSSKKFKGVWDVEWIPTDGEPRTFWQGDVVVMPDVTH